MKVNNFLPFALPDIGEDEISEVINTLRSGWITTGPKAKQFEKDFTQFLGDDSLESIAVNSATSGLHLALEAVGITEGDEVIVPTYTFTATAEIVRYLGAIPIIVDVDPNTFNMTAESFSAAISPKTKAVIPVHFGGLSCDMAEIISLAKQNNIKIIEDAAHALPTKYKGKLIGTLDTDVTIFSFYANKTITTGEGGMVVTRKPKLAERCRIMRLHGISKDAFDRFVSNKPSWFYEVIAPGYKYNMPDISAAIGIHQLKRLKEFQKKRVQMAGIYFDALKNLPLKLPCDAEGESSHAWHLFPIRIQPSAKINRTKFIELMAEHGIGCSVHYIPLHLHPYWRDTYALEPEMFPNAQISFEQEVTLPLYTKMTDIDQQRIIDTIKLLFNA